MSIAEEVYTKVEVREPLDLVPVVEATTRRKTFALQHLFKPA